MIQEVAESRFDDDPLKEIDEIYNDEHIMEEEDVVDELFRNCDTAVRIHCVAHKLQLAINDFLWKNQMNNRLITLAQKLAAKLRNSIVRTMISDAKLKQAILDQKTRWNSTYLMIVRLLDLKEFCEQKSQLLKGLNVSGSKWSSFQEIQEVLKPVAELTARLQHEQLDVTQFVAYWKLAMFKIEKQESGRAADLRRCIEAREQAIFSNRLISCAIYLDKRFSFTLTAEEIVASKNFVLQIWRKKRTLAGENDESIEELPSQINDDRDNSEMSEFGDYLTNQSHSHSTTASSQSSAMRKNPSIIESELNAYDLLPRLPPGEQIMELWKETKAFPVLKEIALDIISVPMTEVSVERLFSHLNFILNQHRSTLNGNLIEDILFLRMNNTFENGL